MSKEFGKYISRCVINGRSYFKAQRVNSRPDQADGQPYWRYQKHFTTLEQAQAFVAEQDKGR